MVIELSICWRYCVGVNVDPFLAVYQYLVGFFIKLISAAALAMINCAMIGNQGVFIRMLSWK